MLKGSIETIRLGKLHVFLDLKSITRMRLEPSQC